MEMRSHCDVKYIANKKTFWSQKEGNNQTWLGFLHDLGQIPRYEDKNKTRSLEALRMTIHDIRVKRGI